MSTAKTEFNKLIARLDEIRALLDKKRTREQRLWLIREYRAILDEAEKLLREN